MKEFRNIEVAPGSPILKKQNLCDMSMLKPR
jgi:hypothetical protein